MSEAKTGDKVAVHYTGKLSDGSTFDSSVGKEPLELELGSAEVIPGFEQAIVGMAVGETRTVEIPAGDAYGERDERLLAEVSRTELPGEFEYEVGQQFEASREDGTVGILVVAAVGEDNVTLDANHPLAGEALTFEIELVKIG